MCVKFLFSSYFSSILGTDEIELSVLDGSTISETIQFFLDNNPEYHQLLKERKTFLLGEFRAIYTLDGKMVTGKHILQDGDNLKILKAYIGG